MTFTEFYSSYSWIAVKRTPARYEFADDADAYRALLQHHEVETKFLIAEVRKLAALLDRHGVKR